MAETCGFVNQSLEPLCCDPPLLRVATQSQGHPFSRSYGANLPNSLTKVLPFTCVYSTRLPVSVCGTGVQRSSLRGFSRQPGSTHFCLQGALDGLSSTGGLAYPSPRLPPPTPAPPFAGWSTCLRPRFAPVARRRNVDRLSITYALRPRLRSWLTRRGRTWRRKPQTFGEHGSHVFYATHACILTSARSTAPSGTASWLAERSPTDRATRAAPSHGFGGKLSPVQFSAQDHSTSELLRTL